MNAKWIPNILSSLRVLIALLFPMIASNFWVGLLTLALVTEFLDGALARKFHWVTSEGQLLDPIADRLLALSVGFTLVTVHRILPMQLVLLLTRDIVVALGLLTTLLFFKGTDITRNFKPNFWGKTTTVLQYLVFYDILLFQDPHKQLFWLTVVFSGISAAFYSQQFLLNRKTEETR